MSLIKNKTIAITGAAGGIGSEIVKCLSKHGAAIHALDRDEKALAHLRTIFPSITTHVLDVTNKADYKKLKFIPDVWINNAGTSFPKEFNKLSDEQFEKILSVNLNGVILGTRHALKLMQDKDEGTVVNVASLAGHIPSPFLSPYTTAKHGVVGFTRGLQLELKHLNSHIKLCLVSPGFVDTDIMKTNPDEFPFPPYLKWLVSKPNKVASDIVHGIIKDKEEVYPGISAHLMNFLYKWTPQKFFELNSKALISNKD